MMPIGEMLLAKKLLESEKARKIGIGALGVVAVGISFAFLGGEIAKSIEDTQQTSISLEVGDATVTEIDREMAEIHLTAFTTEIPAIIAQQTLHRDGFLQPDITEGVVLAHNKYETSLCMPAKKMPVREWISDGQEYAEVVLKASDIKACTSETVDNAPIQYFGGNFITRVNNLDDSLASLFDGADMKKRAEKILSNEDESSKRESKARLVNVAENAGAHTVNEKCAPEVFQVVKEDILDLATESLQRGDEIFTARFEEGIDNAKMSTESDAGEYLKGLSSWVDSSGQTWVADMEVVNMGECKIDPTTQTQAQERHSDQATTETVKARKVEDK